MSTYVSNDLNSRERAVVPELRKAVNLLQKEYEKAKHNPIVRDPLAFALYQTWKAVDVKNGW